MRQLLVALSICPSLLLIAALLVWSYKRRARLQRQAAGSVIRTATFGQDTRPFSPATALAIVPLFATALLLALHWTDIPARFPIHWGIDGQPNGWSARNPLSVFGPMVLGAVLIGFFVLMDVLTERYSPGFAGRATMMRAVHGALTGAAWLIALLFCATSGLPLLKDPTRWIPLFVIGCVLASLSLVIVLVYRLMQMPDSIAEASHRTTEDRFWKGGLIYYNPGDCAVMVPKRDGLGYTMNFGRPVAWIVLGGILLVALAFPVLFHIASRR